VGSQEDKKTFNTILAFSIPLMILSVIVIGLSIFISFKTFSTDFLKTTYIDVKDGNICGTIYNLYPHTSNIYRDSTYTLYEQPFLINIKSIMHTEIGKDPAFENADIHEESLSGMPHTSETLAECGINIYYKQEGKIEVKHLDLDYSSPEVIEILTKKLQGAKNITINNKIIKKRSALEMKEHALAIHDITRAGIYSKKQSKKAKEKLAEEE
jgi:hypothetical protein